MRVAKFTPFSHVLASPMNLAIYGHFGVPVLIFPTASSDFEEYERMGMINALSSHIESGLVKLFCIDSINAESLCNEEISPRQRAARQALYDRYVREEIVPLIHHECGGSLPIATAGASLGAFHAANTLLKHPSVFRWCICMSGLYDISRYFDGYFDENCYFNNPTSYLPGLTDPEIRAQLKRCSINIICGRGPWERLPWSKSFSDLLYSCQIGHNFDVWGSECAHDWPWWQKQMNLYLPRLFA